MDETLAHAAVDVSGRPYCVHTGEPEHMLHSTIAGSEVPYHTVINRHVFESLAMNARIALHVRTLYGRDPHHITEAQYKAVARALRQAVEFDPRVSGVPSTKGTRDSEIRCSTRLRLGQPSVGAAGARASRRRGGSDRGRRCGRRADGLVVPGVGALRGLHGRPAGDRRRQDHRRAGGRGPAVLGVCVGMQILFARGVEFGVESRAAASGRARSSLDAPVIPHMGWNVVDAAAGSALFKGLDPDHPVLFVHSYAAQTWEGDPAALLTWATHNVPFLAAVEDGPSRPPSFTPRRVATQARILLANWVSDL